MVFSGSTDEVLEAEAAFEGQDNGGSSVNSDDLPTRSTESSSPKTSSTLCCIVTRSSPSPSSLRFCCAVSAIISLSATIAAAVSGFFSKDSSARNFDLFDPSTWNPNWQDDNPHGSNEPYDFNTWYTQCSCNGLHLRVVNNLDDKWNPYFERSISDWENGDPDVLSLHVIELPFRDPNCELMQGVLNVCNGDYGRTDWTGINRILVKHGSIVSSVAILNDYHLDKMNDGAKQNIICHELGHGFGLGHWDEDIYNRGK